MAERRLFVGLSLLVGLFAVGVQPVWGSTSGVFVTPEITYLHDGYVANRCSGPTDALHYKVFTPRTGRRHPIAFMFDGTGFQGSADCDPTTHLEHYREMDSIATGWAQAGWVTVNVEYHGYGNGLYGDLTYPGVGNWQLSSIADGTVEIDIKAAVQYFFANNPAQYGADESLGLVAVGSSSGGHDAYMLAMTGVAGHTFSSAVGWSGLPDAQLSGSTAEVAFDTYMRTSPGTDVENFADPMHRIRTGSPPEYVANATREFVDKSNAEAFVTACRQIGVTAWLREPNTTQHAAAYLDYRFTGIPPEFTDPKALFLEKVSADSLGFAQKFSR